MVVAADSPPALGSRKRVGKAGRIVLVAPPETRASADADDDEDDDNEVD